MGKFCNVEKLKGLIVFSFFFFFLNGTRSDKGGHVRERI